MLSLIDIKKDYITGDAPVHALKGISLGFRQHEFVAVLGHSGCGKTTLLNIIGGLDHYTSGDLLVDGRSTKEFTDNDWDAYRNHSIGFIFQSYNLIPHQTVLANVELALTLSGVSPSERRKRAVKALKSVGLGDQINKKPNQMSGGQMQRVAIARALVNNPDIILADEPTGALDTETSVQIMNILKRISKNKLIIMVTHNPELAEEYAERIIRLKDGLIVDDSNPLPVEYTDSETKLKNRRTSMSFFTALSLSMNNLMTKKARTILTAFAGSIGIIGIALIMSLSNGIQNYIDKVQEDTLSSYPITIEAERVDMSSMLSSLMGIRAENESNSHELDAVYSSTVMYDMMNSMLSAETKTNNLNAFKKFLEDDNSEINKYISSVQYSYDFDMNIYARDIDDNIVKTDVVELLQNAMSSMYGGDYSSFFSTYGSYYSVIDVWQELLPGEGSQLINPLLKNQYDVIYGNWPERYDEVVLVVDKNNEISDLVLYALGLKSNSSISDDMKSFIQLDTVESNVESWSYDEICGMTFSYIFPSDEYEYDEETGTYTLYSDDDIVLRSLYNDGMKLKIVGIVRQNEDAVSGMLSGAIGYTHAFVEEVMSRAEKKNIVRKQLSNKTTDVLTGLPFLDKTDTEKAEKKKIDSVKEYLLTADNKAISDIYIEYMCNPTDEYVEDLMSEQLESISDEEIRKTVLDSYPEYASMIENMDSDMLMTYVKQMMSEEIKKQYYAEMSELYKNLTEDELAEDFSKLALENDDYLWIYDNCIPPAFSDSTYADILSELGYVDLDSPSTINIYASTFDDKDAIADEITKYNSTVDEEDNITYTDIVALLMSSITTIINVISYVLIAFVGISLIVSSIMIGIITYISVLERTKEIGILRAIGASKKDISNVFNAETVIIGLGSGLIGVGLTLLLNIPINMLVHDLTGIYSLNSSLPAIGGVALVAISVLLTFIAGLIPSGIAAGKDPVEALRTE